MSKSQRTKGAAAERELAAILSDELGVCVKRKLGAARDGGSDIDVGRFKIEAKRQETIKMSEWCKQAEENAGDGDIPVVAFRRSGQPWRVVLPLKDFVTLMRGEL